MSGSLTFPRLGAREIISVQPMALPSSLIFYMDYRFDSDVVDAVKDDHKPGDGTFCECFVRCYVCHPMTKEEAEKHEAAQIEFKKVKLP